MAPFEWTRSTTSRSLGPALAFRAPFVADLGRHVRQTPQLPGPTRPGRVTTGAGGRPVATDTLSPTASPTRSRSAQASVLAAVKPAGHRRDLQILHRADSQSSDEEPGGHRYFDALSASPPSSPAAPITSRGSPPMATCLTIRLTAPAPDLLVRLTQPFFAPSRPTLLSTPRPPSHPLRRPLRDRLLHSWSRRRADPQPQLPRQPAALRWRGSNMRVGVYPHCRRPSRGGERRLRGRWRKLTVRRRRLSRFPVWPGQPRSPRRSSAVLRQRHTRARLLGAQHPPATLPRCPPSTSRQLRRRPRRPRPTRRSGGPPAGPADRRLPTPGHPRLQQPPRVPAQAKPGKGQIPCHRPLGCDRRVLHMRPATLRPAGTDRQNRPGRHRSTGPGRDLPIDTLYTKIATPANHSTSPWSTGAPTTSIPTTTSTCYSRAARSPRPRRPHLCSEARRRQPAHGLHPLPDLRRARRRPSPQRRALGSLRQRLHPRTLFCPHRLPNLRTLRPGPRRTLCKNEKLITPGAICPWSRPTEICRPPHVECTQKSP